MKNNINRVSFNESKALAYCWFFLSFVLTATSIYIPTGKGVFLIPGFFGLSLIIFMVGRQRLNQYRLDDEKFRKIVRGIALFVAIWCSVIAAISSSIQ